MVKKKRRRMVGRIIVFWRGHGCWEWGFTVCLSTGPIFSDFSLSDKENKNNDVFLCDGDAAFLKPEDIMKCATDLCNQFGIRIAWKHYKTEDQYGNPKWPKGVPVPKVPKKYARTDPKPTAASKKHRDEISIKRALRAMLETKQDKKDYRESKIRDIKKKIEELGLEPVRFITKRTKMLKDITAADIPPGLDAEDIAIDCSPGYSDSSDAGSFLEPS